LSAPFSATDCVGALFRELRRHATDGSIKLMVTVDRANSLYAGRTMHKKQDFTRINTDELTIALHVKKFFNGDWKNGVCILVADEAEFSPNRRDTQTIRLYTPLEMFGEQVCLRFDVNDFVFRALKQLIRLFQLRLPITQKRKPTLFTTTFLKSIGSQKVNNLLKLKLTSNNFSESARSSNAIVPFEWPQSIPLRAHLRFQLGFVLHQLVIVVLYLQLG
jgi:hypothetical protein